MSDDSIPLSTDGPAHQPNKLPDKTMRGDGQHTPTAPAVKRKPPRRQVAVGNGTLQRTMRGKLKKEEAELQGTAMLTRRVMLNETHAEIARMFNTSPQMVAKRLADSRTSDLTALARDIISERMLPRALAILDRELQDGSYEAAKDVLFGSQVLQKGGKSIIEHQTSATPTLDAIRAERQKAIEGQIVVSQIPQVPHDESRED